MENIEKKIDTMSRDKIGYLLAENSVRIKKINTRFSSSNKFNTMERLEASLASYDRLIRSVSKERFNIEKMVRLRYIIELTPARLLEIKKENLNEVESILKDMSDEYRVFYVPFGKAEEFDEQVNFLLEKARDNIEAFATKTAQAINAEVNETARISPQGLEDVYAIDQSSLVDLGLIKPLQNIRLVFEAQKDETGMKEIAANFDEAIREYVTIGKTQESTAWSIPSVRGRKEKKMEIAGHDILLKEIVYGFYTFAQNADKPKEARNLDMIRKVWENIDCELNKIPGTENVKAKLKIFYDWFNL
ncbi:MAG: hypothetical protein COV66_11050 [Nitrospinae bacterium CG11_big_fil_rev_8_21_14_0_20_45_15]|nr:MAG: hypothetical protein COV66_11050 [Nitrospinae bacterium CG11_big_fil_rev_8_21_14_0_20_45_15]